MHTRGTSTRLRRAALWVVPAMFVALLPAAHSASSAAAGGADAVSPALFRKGLEADGKVVRRADGVRVTRVVVEHKGDAVVLYRVRVAGDFPPRALRYVVLSGGDQVGFGVPTADGRAVRTVTRDRGVLDERIRARYGDTRSTVPSSNTGAAPTSIGGMRDPSAPGPYDVSGTRYDLGDQVFQPTDVGARVEVTARVQYPTDLAGGPYPLVLFLHGNHSTCYKGNRTRFQWPCREGWRPLQNHAGYDYIAKPLASHGYIVVSVSANGVNALGSRLPDTAMRQRGELLDKHLRLWRRWSSAPGGPFGARFVGAVDMTRIGTMGHSRGGEGVVWHKVVDDARPTPFGIDAVLALAPVDFTRITINEVPFAVMLPTCDGDVSDLQGVHFFDDSRYNLPGDPGAKHTVTVFGANHNFFNKVWSPSSDFPGAGDDAGSCPDERLTEKRQRRIGASYIMGFFRRYLEDDLSLDRMWTGAAIPRFTGSDEVRVSYHAPATHRRDLVRFTEADDLTRNQLGGEMVPQALTNYGWCANTWETPCLSRGDSYLDIHRPGLAQGILGWESHDALLGMRVPAGSRNVSGFDAFQFRAVVPPGYDTNRRIKYQDLVVAFIDGAGDEVEVPASEVGNDQLAVPSRRSRTRMILNQIRFPLTRFQGVDLTDVREVQFRFSRNLRGVVHVTDVAFSSGRAIVPKV